ncbi:MAG: methylated-DNA--[protein]-cysteine S-methyltransferase [Corticimicrobacter sp.]|uniref:methylated-DNA--[protein]-cysteine S-methyltransferase n=1 Tax=Corticimicrobacter sp. TaxID=2678536 RepID=UPI0032DA0530
MIAHTHIDSPLGPLLLAANRHGLCLIEFPSTRHPYPRTGTWREQPDHPVLQQARSQLSEYFAGQRRIFDLPLAPQGTPFQMTVWQALASIGYGETLSYAGLAERVRHPRAARAVGAANGRNPLPIVLPCHRVIGTNGSLTGFAGGLPAKRFLLSHEGALPQATLRPGM